MSIEQMTYNQWQAEGICRFGINPFDWKFVCPSCGNVQSALDFRTYRNNDATPNSANQVCLGRYTGAGGAFDAQKHKPCNYALNGLIHLDPHVEVTFLDGK